MTPEGDTISPHGVLTGGSGAAVEKASLPPKEKLSSWKKKYLIYLLLLEEQMLEKKKLVSSIARWDEELTGLKNRTHRLEIEIHSRKKIWNALKMKPAD